MGKRVIRGYWDCPYCGTAGIDGLKDKCPNCGTGKPENTKYYMKNKQTVSDEELLKAGIGLDENDGKHKEWVCPYCGQLNNWGDQTCVSCAAPKDSKEKEYGDAFREPSVQKSVSVQPARRSKVRTILLAIALVLGILFFPWKKTQTVESYHWQTVVNVEESRIVEESDWQLPEGGELIESRREIHHYEQVIDHYEKVAVQRSREVRTGSHEVCSYSDNGNGTFSEDCYNEPEYSTEYYTEYVNEPVYRSEPRYQTKYYYRILRWFVIDSYELSGEDKHPVYASNYKLTDNTRDSNREVKYYVTLNDEQTIEVSEEAYETVEVGMKQSVTRNLLGMEYGRSQFQ